MLVLGRRENEQIKIGDDVVITVVRARNGHVRLGIEAPTELRISRSPSLVDEHRVHVDDRTAV